MDDLLTGSETSQEVIQLLDQIVEISESGYFLRYAFLNFRFLNAYIITYQTYLNKCIENTNHFLNELSSYLPNTFR